MNSGTSFLNVTLWDMAHFLPCILTGLCRASCLHPLDAAAECADWEAENFLFGHAWDLRRASIFPFVRSGPPPAAATDGSLRGPAATSRNNGNGLSLSSGEVPISSLVAFYCSESTPFERDSEQSQAFPADAGECIRARYSTTPTTSADDLLRPLPFS
jgi:hypothetical protein